MISLPLTRGYETIVDDIDGDLALIGWRVAFRNGKPYVRLGTKSGEGCIHRFIMERIMGRKLAKGEMVIHLNRDMLDNRRDNLRLFHREAHISQNCAVIELTRGRITLVDVEDADLAQYSWHISPGSQRYAIRRVWSKDQQRVLPISMHRIVCSRKIGRELSVGEIVDHINGDGLDNRRCNLRLASPSQNVQNAKCYNKSVGYKGVRVTRNGKYQARIYVNGHRLTLGTFGTPQEANSAYWDAAQRYFGEFSRKG